MRVGGPRRGPFSSKVLVLAGTLDVHAMVRRLVSVSRNERACSNYSPRSWRGGGLLKTSTCTRSIFRIFNIQENGLFYVA